MASLAALRIKAAAPAAQVMVTTFRRRAAGDAAFQANYDQVITHSIRSEYQDDMVPHLRRRTTFSTC